MNISHQIEPTSSDHLLTCLGLAVDEAKLVSSTIKSRDMPSNIQTLNFDTENLAKLDREIAILKRNCLLSEGRQKRK